MPARGTSSAVPGTIVTTTRAVSGSPSTSAAPPSTTGTSGGKCSSGSPSRRNPSPAQMLSPLRM